MPIMRFPGPEAGRMLQHRLLLGMTAWLACCATSVVIAADDSVVGFVLDVSGKWIVVGDSKKGSITGGDQLSAGTVVRPEGDTKDAFLRVCLYDGTTINYKKEEKLPKREKEGLTNRIWSAVAGRYRGGVVQAASRGDDLLTDGLASVKDDKVDLTPLMTELPDGTWSFRIRKPGMPAKEEGQTEAKTWTVSVKWTAGETAVVDVAGLKPGLYELQVINPRTKRPLGASALALICPADVFEKRQAAYEEAVKLTESWNDEIRDDTAVPFLRAYLDVLASTDR